MKDFIRQLLQQARIDERNKCLKEHSFKCCQILREEKRKATEPLIKDIMNLKKKNDNLEIKLYEARAEERAKIFWGKTEKETRDSFEDYVRAETLKTIWKQLCEWNAFDPNIDTSLHLIWLKKKLGIKL